MLRQYELVERVKRYDPDADEAMINRAYVFSVQKHGSQKRASGDPYFSHPIEVAGILTDFYLDDQTIVTALLHDTIEDTLVTYDEIEEAFGKDVARMVDGVTKLSKIEAMSENERAAENLRKFLLAMSDDIRVLLVKLADRLHNMRTLHFIKNEQKRRRIAKETMDIYAPLAERIGMYDFMREMQLLAFRVLEPEAYDSITKRLEQLKEGGHDKVDRIGAELPRAAVDLHALDFPTEPDGQRHRYDKTMIDRAWAADAARPGTRFAEFPNVASYAPTLYAPSAVGLAIGDALGLPRIGAFYAGRIVNALTALLLLVAALRLIPFGRMALLGTALLPTFCYQIGSLSPGTGAQFAILPPQNATGNFVKVVQRVPIRIYFDETDKYVRKLKAGMSVYATIDTGHQRSLAGLFGLSATASQDNDKD